MELCIFLRTNVFEGWKIYLKVQNAYGIGILLEKTRSIGHGKYQITFEKKTIVAICSHDCPWKKVMQNE